MLIYMAELNVSPSLRFHIFRNNKYNLQRIHIIYSYSPRLSLMNYINYVRYNFTSNPKSHRKSVKKFIPMRGMSK
jgi:hypothetical protein